jgi:hypothetical protein
VYLTGINRMVLRPYPEIVGFDRELREMVEKG